MSNHAAPDDLLANFAATSTRLQEARSEISRIVIGQQSVVDLSLVALLSGGHGLLIGLPGLGKTLLVETIAKVCGLMDGRVQFTPDLMPSDILGSEVLETATDGSRAFRYIKGPIFAQLLMADEINRASPRTQAALLQAMQEDQVTIAGETYDLPQPFHVLATQNPLEQEGTYPLPEAQLDRFMMQITVPYPSREAEAQILTATTGTQKPVATQVLDAQMLMDAAALVRAMPIGQSVVERILDLVRACRPDTPEASALVQNNIAWGPGPRAAQALMQAARALALLEGRMAPSAHDVERLALPVLGHRMSLSFAARANGVSLSDVIEQVQAQIAPNATAA